MLLPPIAYRAALTHLARRHRGATTRSDAGYSTEAVVVIALLVAAAIVVLGILTVKLTNRANTINF
ncbi:MAG: hypothetical protein L0Y54_04675 [Sporichthyaceae bacterium]|nr:hypothetical protein [Sporichthyaceae bacterium]